ncbi:kynureninase [Pseudactinotalea sp.]|uniref:kynureninase n=1 Tax=Pseudactinotalea sp. TaxID=1926260 RepID=UPI003B3BA1B7
MPLTREHARDLDAADPLADCRRVVARVDDVLYLDGNSLGRMPVATPPVLRALVEEEWGRDLVRSWPAWLDLATETSDLLGREILGVGPGQVVISDTTTVNLYKLAVAAVRARPGRRRIVVEEDNFPTDLYVLDGVARDHGLELTRIPTDIDDGVRAADLRAVLGDDVALVALSHVSYRSGALLDMVGLTRLAHEAGALVLWDLCHSAGAALTPLSESEVDLAVGCTYKYLNAGPGAPAYLYVRADLQAQLRSPIQGWFGQTDQFAMGPDYEPVEGIERFLAGSLPVPGILAVREGVNSLAAAGVPALRDKGVALTEYLISLADAWLEPLGFRLASPREGALRGSHVTLEHPQAWQVCQAWIADGVIGDFRTPDRLRIGPAPLYTSFEEVWVAMDRLRTIVEAGTHLTFPTERSRVT